MLAAAVAICLVVGVTDGDTAKVRCGDSPEQKVRLYQIDAPEKSQPFGQRAKQHLSDLVYKRQVELADHGKDRYGRTLGAIKVGGQDINWQMVRDGMAWCYLKYLRDKSCLAMEREAREARAGLWQDEAPIEPWLWRHPTRGR